MSTPRTPGWPPDQSRTSGRVYQLLPDLQVGLSTTPEPPGGSTDHSRPHPDHQDCLPTTPRPQGEHLDHSRTPGGLPTTPEPP